MMEQDVDRMSIVVDQNSEIDIDVDMTENYDSINDMVEVEQADEEEGEDEDEDDQEEEDEDLDSEADRESGLETDSDLSVKSILDEDFVLEEHYEHGRRYANSTYFYPSDEIEETRLSIIHQVYLSVLRNELLITRITRNDIRILDVGTGPGDWAIAMGEKYPYAEVIGTDLTTYHTTNLPPNVTLQIDDASQQWTFTEPFDIIHIRDLHGAFKDWVWIFSEARKHLTEDGKLEIANAGPFKLTQNYEKSYTALFHGLFRQAMEKSGLSWAPGTNKGELEAAGLRSMRNHTVEIPLGQWNPDPSKRVAGKMALVAALESVEACSLRVFTRFLEWDIEQVKDLCEKVKEELQDPRNKPVLVMEFVVARKLPKMPDY